MFEIQLGPAGAVMMAGRLDATQCEAALKFLDALAPLASVLQADLQFKNIEPGKFHRRPIERDKSRRVDAETLLDIRRFQHAPFHAHRAVRGRSDKPDRRQWAGRGQ